MILPSATCQNAFARHSAALRNTTLLSAKFLPIGENEQTLEPRSTRCECKGESRLFCRQSCRWNTSTAHCPMDDEFLSRKTPHNGKRGQTPRPWLPLPECIAESKRSVDKVAFETQVQRIFLWSYICTHTERTCWHFSHNQFIHSERACFHLSSSNRKGVTL